MSKYLWALLNLVINKSITDSAKLDFMRYYYENGAPLDRTGGEGYYTGVGDISPSRDGPGIRRVRVRAHDL